MSHNIPIEIQMEIVKRLPVKSLFQFRSVSKSWKTLIDSSQFIADYNACESRPQRLLIRYKSESGPKCVCIVDDDIFPQHKFATTVPLSVEELDVVRLVGSSQGLVCLLVEHMYGLAREMAIIWNPAIRKSIAIHVSGFHQMHATNLGFGVCPNTNEPMLVRIFGYVLPFLFVEVFTLSSGVWRSSRGSLPPRSILFTRSQVAIDGFIYWQSFTNCCIVSFDMTSEEFAEIDLPYSLAYSLVSNPDKTWSISKLRESLAVLEHYMDAEKPVCAVWMMEHGVSKSFTKLFSVSTPNVLQMKVLGFRKNGEVILEASTDDEVERAVLEVYEPRSEHNKDLGISGEYGSFFMSSYTETLLLLDQPDNFVFKLE